MNAPFPASRLTCERCSGHGYIKTGLGRLACLECSAAASSWIPASQPPACELSESPGYSLRCLAVTSHFGYPDVDTVAYWPATGRWTMSLCNGDGPDDVEVEVSHWMKLPPLPV